MREDYFLEDYKASEERYRTAANEEFLVYTQHKDDKFNPYVIQTILNNAMQASINKYLTRIRRIKISQKEKKFRLFDRRNEQIKMYNLFLEDIRRALSLNIVANPLIKGDLKYSYCKAFEKEDNALYSLFEDIIPYYNENKDNLDEDRKGLLDVLNAFKKEYQRERNGIVKKEEVEVDYALEVMLHELEKDFSDVLGNNMVNLIGEVRQHMSIPNEENLDYIKKLNEGHTPKYDDGFESYTKNHSIGTFETNLENVGDNRSESITSNYDMKAIKENLYLKKQTEEVLKILENVELVLESRDTQVIDPSCNNVISYINSLQSISNAIQYCRGLVNRYQEKLNLLNYEKLYQELLNQKNMTGIGETEKLENASGLTYDKVHPDLRAASPVSIEEDINSRIAARGLTPELLEFSTEDLYKFGFVPTDKFEELDSHSKAMVIEHCSDLKDLLSLSEEERYNLRASWPRMEDGKVVTRQKVSEEDILNQRNMDDNREFNGRLNALLKVKKL